VTPELVAFMHETFDRVWIACRHLARREERRRHIESCELSQERGESVLDATKAAEIRRTIRLEIHRERDHRR
jgi:hypothetical protein